MGEALHRSFRAGWGQMDLSAHMAKPAYLDPAADTRLQYSQALCSSQRDTGAGS